MHDFSALASLLTGKLYTDNIHLTLYSTDASAYKERPLAVCYPAHKEDIITIINYASQHNLTIIPRAAGTSLAGQVVGNGIIVDISNNFNKIIEVDINNKSVVIEPGVVLDELNKYLSQYNLFFAPETSTSNRCMIGGMVGNNSCGSHSLIYGSTREHLLELECILSDGSCVTFKDLTKQEFEDKCKLKTLEGDIYRHIYSLLSDDYVVSEINNQYPKKNITRRNTGYAIDMLIDNEIFTLSDKKFNFCKLIAGSEGTLCFITKIKLNLIELPPNTKLLLVAHAHSLKEVYLSNLIALKYNPASIELMDKKVLDLAKSNISQNKNRFFINGDPAAILIVEWYGDNIEDLKSTAIKLELELKENNLCYAFPLLLGEDINKVWALRKAGLGVLSNMIGDAKPVPVIEDTAVSPEDLPEYMSDFNIILNHFKLECVHYAHIGTGELHLRPILNLKDKVDVELFYELAYETAKLVKKYKGSLSGEHGDGRLRGQFIKLMYGEKIYNYFVDLKKVWDINNVFNKHKIIDTPPMNSSLRYTVGQKTKEISTYFDFSSSGGYLRSVEKCNGSADCRKSSVIGGTLCPSYQASKDEKNSTRARANFLRETLTNSKKKNPFDEKELFYILDNCLLCKACKAECPSSIDMAKLKMEFLQHYYDANHVPIRALAVAYLPQVYQMLRFMPNIVNFFLKNKYTSSLLKKTIKFHNNRTFPSMSNQNFNDIFKKLDTTHTSATTIKTIYLFNDEFTNFLESNIGLMAILLLRKLGYDVKIAPIKYSARTWLSKGLIKRAAKIANKNIEVLKCLIDNEHPLVGIEPSALLSFRDEYPDLANKINKEAANELSKHCYTFEEFFAKEINNGKINQSSFTEDEAIIKFHGHCQQKSISSTSYTLQILQFPKNYKVSEIPSGCCGMAGSFGYEKEHYELSMKIGELVLFPAIRDADKNTIIVAAGTSCRCQIEDATKRKAVHPIEVLYKACII